MQKNGGIDKSFSMSVTQSWSFCLIGNNHPVNWFSVVAGWEFKTDWAPKGCPEPDQGALTVFSSFCPQPQAAEALWLWSLKSLSNTWVDTSYR